MDEVMESEIGTKNKGAEGRPEHAEVAIIKLGAELRDKCERITVQMKEKHYMVLCTTRCRSVKRVNDMRLVVRRAEACAQPDIKPTTRTTT
eukprot:3059851-Heterocapsa_arctica.AAC.1